MSGFLFIFSYLINFKVTPTANILLNMYADTTLFKYLIEKYVIIYH